MPNRLQWAKQKIITNFECGKSYHQQKMVKLETICSIGWDSPWQYACSGDGGVWTQIGVFSFFHETGCETGQPSGFVRITSYFDWIAKIAGYSFRP